MGSSQGAGPVDRVIVLAVMAGAWWALWLGEWLSSEEHRRALARLDGPDWDVRATLAPGPTGPMGEPPEPYPRALRQAKGIGRMRALDLARFYQLAGPKAPADALHGVGSTTARAAAEVVSNLMSTQGTSQTVKSTPSGLDPLPLQPPE